MTYKAIFFGTITYTFGTFLLAIFWHITLFEEIYLAFGYFEGNPDFLMGFLSIFIQGLILSFLYPFVQFKGSGIVRGLKFSCSVGLFFWTSHVLAFMAKHPSEGTWNYLAMESFFLSLQFGIFGTLIGLIYSRLSENSADAESGL